jgi:hypothetical protein
MQKADSTKIAEEPEEGASSGGEGGDQRGRIATRAHNGATLPERLCSAKMSSDPPDWLWLGPVGSMGGSRRGLLQGIFMMETAQNRRAANYLPGRVP